MKVYCPILRSGKYFPARCASGDMPGGMNVSPHIAWSDVPRNTRSFVLTMVDGTLPADYRVHWLVINIAAKACEVLEKSSGIRDRLPRGCLELRHSFGEVGYTGPLLPQGAGLHTYTMIVYAVSEETLEFGPLSLLDEVLAGIGGKIRGTGSTVGMLKV